MTYLVKTICGGEREKVNTNKKMKRVKILSFTVPVTRGTSERNTTVKYSR